MDAKKLERQEPITLAMNFSPDNKTLTFITGKKELRSWNLTTNTIENNQQLSSFGSNPVFTQDLSVVAGDSNRENRMFIWKNNKFALESLPLEELITFMIVNKLGFKDLSFQMRMKTSKLPPAITKYLLEQK